MSGTSLDGISAAVARFTPSDGARYHVDLLGFNVHEYAPAPRERMLAAMREGTARDYCRLAADFGGWLADAAVAVLAEAGVARADVRAIGSPRQKPSAQGRHPTRPVRAPGAVPRPVRPPVVSGFPSPQVATGRQG